jgi:hypothetical protein
MSVPSQAALSHLRIIKPNDGWSVQKEPGQGLRLLRRNVPVSDTYFQDIHYCPDANVVVGVLTSDGSTCQVLVDEFGKPVTSLKVMSISTYVPNSAKNVNFAKSRTQKQAPSAAVEPPSQSDAPIFLPNMIGEDSKQLVQYALCFLAGLIFLKVLSDSSLASLLVLALPLVYIYGVQTCPTSTSFDAKKELKRVLRGHHLPEDHPNKPKGFLEEMAARVAASVTAELVTLPGYELEMTNLGGAGWVAHVRVPSANIQCFWIGAFSKWTYICSFDTPERPLSHQ